MKIAEANAEARCFIARALSSPDFGDLSQRNRESGTFPDDWHATFPDNSGILREHTNPPRY